MTLTLSSRLLPLLFQRPDIDRGLKILDTGPAIPETVDFFSQFKCRLHFMDFYSEPRFRELSEDVLPEERQAMFAELIQFPEETKFDICLFWDFLNYLNRQDLEAFTGAIRPYLDRKTRGHAFSVLNANTKLENNLYGILAMDRLCIKPCPDRQLRCYPRPQLELNNSLSGFVISRSTLMADRRLEILLHSDLD